MAAPKIIEVVEEKSYSAGVSPPVRVRFDDDTLVSIGIPQEELDREHAAEERLNAAVRETMLIDWAEEIKLLQKEKRALEKEVVQLRKDIADAKAHPYKVSTEHALRGFFESVVSDDDAWNIAREEWQSFLIELQEYRTILRRAQKYLDRLKEEVDAADAKSKDIIHKIDWAKSEKSAASRVNKWCQMTMAGCPLGDVIDGTKK